MEEEKQKEKMFCWVKYFVRNGFIPVKLVTDQSLLIMKITSEVLLMEIFLRHVEFVKCKN